MANQNVGTGSVSSSSDSFATDRKRVNRYAFPAGEVLGLHLYVAPTSTSGAQRLRGVLYADEGGKPGRLIGSTQEQTINSPITAGWIWLAFSTPPNLAAGNYWI